MTIEMGPGKAPADLQVKTESVRDGKAVALGKARVVPGDRVVCACYGVYPSAAGVGECVIRTTVQAGDGVKSLEFKATIPK